MELFDGLGSLVEGTIQRIDKNGSDIAAVKDPITVAPYGMQWHVFAAFGEFCTPFLLLQIKFKLFSFINLN